MTIKLGVSMPAIRKENSGETVILQSGDRLILRANDHTLSIVEKDRSSRILWVDDREGADDKMLVTFIHCQGDFQCLTEIIASVCGLGVTYDLSSPDLLCAIFE